MPNGGDRRELGCLLQEATRLLEATDLSGANETLKAAEEALVSVGEGSPALEVPEVERQKS